MGKPSKTTRETPLTPLENTQGILSPSEPNRRWTGWHIFALCILGLLGFASSFSYIWDFDIFWHLACGEWMFRHHEVMRFDYFCLDPNPNGWTDVHWFFQLIVTAIYKVGGWGLLSVFKGVAAATILMAYVASLRRHVPTAWLIGVGILLLYVMQSRLRVRPEVFTLCLLLLTFALVDSVRRGSPAIRLWWMVPVMILWVNMHGLFFLGLAILWGTVIGAAIDRALDRWKWPLWGLLALAFGVFVGVVFWKLGQPLDGAPAKFLPEDTDFQRWLNRYRFWVFGGVGAAVFAALGLIKRERGLGGKLLNRQALLPILAATVACLLTPWPLETIQLPLLLSTRLSDPTYVTGVTELHRTYQHFPFHYAAILMVLLTACAMLANFRYMPLSHIGIFSVFIVMGLLARRNVGMLGPILGFLLALHGAGALKELGDWKPFLRRVGPAMIVLFSAVALGLSSVYLTGTIQRYWDGHGAQPGAGLQRDTFNIDMGKFLADLDVEGDLMCENFGDGGTFDYYLCHGRDMPKRRLYMDGRLEAHSLEKFNRMKEYRSKLSSPFTAGQVVFPPSIRFVQVRFDSEPKLSALMQAKMPLSRDGGTGVRRYANRYRLIYIDQAGALFARLDWNQGLPGIHDNAKIPDQPNFEDFDLPLATDYSLEGTSRARNDWHLQNAPAVNLQIAGLLLNLGKQPSSLVDADSAEPVQERCVLLAIRYFHAAAADGLGSRNQTQVLLAEAYAQRAWQDYYGPSAVVPIDVESACALRRFGQMYLRGMDAASQTTRCQQWLDTLVRAGMLDHTQAEQERLYKERRVTLDDSYGKKLQRIRDQAVRQKVYQMPLLQRARELASPRFGLIDEAVALLKKDNSPDPQARMLLGDLLLRLGQTERTGRLAARAVYAKVNLPPDQAWQLSLRLALCDWVDGKLWPAADALKNLAAKTDQPVVKFYRFRLANELGQTATINEYAHDADLKTFTLRAKGLR